jgi:hypothetical protein
MGMVCSGGMMVACGAANQPCCASATCANNGCCGSNRCTAQGAMCPAGGTCGMNGGCGNCGAAGQQCCDGDPAGSGMANYCTRPGLRCSGNNNCVACGGPGQPCCHAGTCAAGGCCNHGENGGLGICVAAGMNCPNNGGMCSGGGCQGGNCGKVGQPPCPGNLGCTAPNTSSVNNLCLPCGGLNQRCCGDGQSGGVCNAPYACDDRPDPDVCRECGGPGQVCCVGSRCNMGQCNNSLCP